MSLLQAKSSSASLRAGSVRAHASRRLHLQVNSKLVLKPTGSGSTVHLDGEAVQPPQHYVLREGTLDVGRQDTCAVPIRIPTVSSRHAILTVEGDKVLVYDVNSTNGTVLNGKDLKPMSFVEVPVGSEIVFGDEHLAKFVLEKLPDEEAVAASPSH